MIFETHDAEHGQLPLCIIATMADSVGRSWTLIEKLVIASAPQLRESKNSLKILA